MNEEKDTGPVVGTPNVKAEAIITVFDKDGNEKGKIKFTNDPEEMKDHETERSD